jgi:hopanoid biosynthesis associated protein HpnK
MFLQSAKNPQFKASVRRSMKSSYPHGDVAYAPRRGVKRLIVTADDFGLSVPLNEAVERAHCEGVLSAASLMVGAPAAEDAVERGRKLPSLGVGLHLTLLDGRPVLPPDQIPGLVGPDGRFLSNPVRVGLALYVSRELQRQAKAEINAQFERFRGTGLTMDHVNAHRHFHLHPVVLQSIMDFAPRFGKPPVRTPLEPFMPSFIAGRNRAFGRLLSFLFYFAQTRRIERSLHARQIPSNDHLFGLNDSGALTESLLLGLLDHLPDGVSEIYCHPATRNWEGEDNLPACYRPERELEALLSPAVKMAMERRGLRPLPYRPALNSVT